MNPVFALFCLLATGLAPALTFAAPAEELLLRLNRATRGLNYEGIFVYQQKGELDAMRLIHKVNQDGEHERLVSLNGEAREVLRDNDEVTCVLPGNKSVMVDKTFPRASLPTFPSDLTSLRGYYDFVVADGGRVAGRGSRSLIIRSKDAFRYGYRLWLDQEHGLLLKSELVSNDGQVVERLMFTDLRVYDAIPDALLKPDVVGKEYTWVEDEDTDQLDSGRDSPWRVARLPQGFMLSHRARQHLPAVAMLVDHFVYTDGLAWISVYIEPIQEQAMAVRGVSRMGAVNAFSTVVDKHQITVVGEVPEQTVKYIGNSVMRIPTLAR